jgi:hypothetical protein
MSQWNLPKSTEIIHHPQQPKSGIIHPQLVCAGAIIVPLLGNLPFQFPNFIIIVTQERRGEERRGEEMS